MALDFPLLTHTHCQHTAGVFFSEPSAQRGLPQGDTIGIFDFSGTMAFAETEQGFYGVCADRSRLAQWKNHDPLNPKKGRGFNLKESIDKNQVIYIRSHAKDKLVRKASSILVEELTQIGLNRGQDQHQIFFVFDELRFIVSDAMVDSLATLLSKGINMALAYQTISDLLNLPDA